MTTMHTPPLALIVGARGGFGQAMGEALTAQGWRVRALARSHAGGGVGPHAASQTAGSGAWQWVSGDALRPDDVSRAAEGVQVVVHAANPPGYRHWEALAMPMLHASMAAAQRQGARLLLPGNVYHLPWGLQTPLGEDAALWRGRGMGEPGALTRKGRVRQDMELALQEAAARDGLASLVLRAGDFFGGVGASSWFNNVMVRPGRPVRRVVDPQVGAVGHTWVYLPDMAQAAARLLMLDQAQPRRLALAECVHMRGHDLADGHELARCVADVVAAHGQPRPRVVAMPWWVVGALRAVVPLLREVHEMRELWCVPLRLDNARLLSLLGDEPHTPLPQAVTGALMRLGCLPVGPIRTPGSAWAT